MQPKAAGMQLARKIIRFTGEICHPCYYLACRREDEPRWRGVFESLPPWCGQSLLFKGSDNLVVESGKPIDARL